VLFFLFSPFLIISRLGDLCPQDSCNRLTTSICLFCLLRSLVALIKSADEPGPRVFPGVNADCGLRTVAGSPSQPSGARAWPRIGCLARGAASRGPGGAPDSLGVPGLGQAQEFSQAAPRISGSAKWPGRPRSPAAPGPGPASAVPLAEPLPGALGVPQTAWVCRVWASPQSFPRRHRGFRSPHSRA
jgi:hypothetical protein